MESDLRTALLTREAAVRASFAHRFERAPMRFSRAVEGGVVGAMVEPMLGALALAVHDGPAAQPGSAAARELEQACGFFGARMAQAGAAGFDVAAALLCLRDAVGEVATVGDATAVAPLFEWLLVIALDSFAAAGRDALREQMNDQLEHGTPVVTLLRDVPAVFLLGDPSPAVLDAVLGRATLAGIGAQGRCLIIDLHGLSEPGRANLTPILDRFFAQAEVKPWLMVLVEDSAKRRAGWEAAAQRAGVATVACDDLARALELAAERTGRPLVRR